MNIWSSQVIDITNNLIFNNNEDGIKFYSVSLNRLSINNRIFNNHIIENINGIYLEGSHSTFIDDNVPF